MLKRSFLESALYALCFALSFVSCSTTSLNSSAMFLSDRSVENIATEITKNIISYPEPLLIESNRKINKAIGQSLLNNGLNIQFYTRSFGQKTPKNSALIEVTEHRENEVIVIVDTPYFTTSQLFDSRDGAPSSNQSLMLKPAPYNRTR